MGFFRDLYDVFIGDKKRHNTYLERKRAVEELAKGRDLTNVIELNRFIQLVERELNITQISEGDYRRYHYH